VLEQSKWTHGGPAFHIGHFFSVFLFSAIACWAADTWRDRNAHLSRCHRSKGTAARHGAANASDRFIVTSTRA